MIRDRLVPNWRRKLLFAYSLWSMYLGYLCFWAPQLLYLRLGYDIVSPLFWFGVGNALFLFGIIGSVIRQRKVSG